MLSVSSIGSASGAAEYYGKDDYYVTGEADSPGLEWGGKGAATVGLTGKADPADFKAVLSGEHKMFADQEKGGGPSDAKHRAGWDLTFSAPKSVSLAILVGGDKKLDVAHDKAVARAMAYAEKHFAITRVRDQGKIKEVKTGNLIYAQTVHGTSRKGDPQRHTHVIVANATVEPGTGKVRAVESLQIFKHSQLLGRIYRAELAKEALKLGYDVRQDRAQGTFELGGVGRDQLQAFSKRNTDIRAAIEVEERKRGARLSPAQRDAIVLKDRPKKLDVPRSELVIRWEKEAKEAGLDMGRLVAESRERGGHGTDVTPQVSGVASDSKSRFIAAMKDIVGRFKEASSDPYGYKPGLPFGRDQDARAAVSFGLQHAEQGKAVFTRHEVLAKALHFGAAGLTAGRVERQLTQLERDGRVMTADVRLHGGVTTKAALDLETRLTERVKAGKGVTGAIMDAPAAKAALNAIGLKTDGIRLNEGQERAAEKLLTSNDRYVGVQGSAGVGKTTMFKVVNEIAAAQGVEIYGLAPTHDATRALTEGAGIPAQTVEKFLVRVERMIERAETNKDAAAGLEKVKGEWGGRILLVDESSMLSNRQADRLMNVSEALGVRRVVNIGDERQLGSPEAGAPWRLLLNEGLDHSKMTEIRRQRDPEIKTSVEHLAKGAPTPGLRALGSRVVQVGKEAVDKDLTAAAFKSWQEVKGRGQEASVIVPTHSLRASISALIREDLASRNQLTGASVSAETFSQVRMSRAESLKASSYSEGQVLVFHSGIRDAGIRKGDTLTVVGRDERNDRLIVSRADESRTTVDLPQLATSRNAGKFQAYVPKTLDVKAGELMVWERRDEARGFNTGERFSVVRMGDGAWTIRGADGKEQDLKPDDPALKFISHGYVETADRSQGSTYDNVIAVLSSKHGEAANQARAYVQVSRTAETLTFITNNADLLARRLNRQDGLNLIASHELKDTLEARAELAALASGLTEDGPEPAKADKLATLAADGLGGPDKPTDPAHSKSAEADMALAGSMAGDQSPEVIAAEKSKDDAGDKDKAFDKAQEINQPDMGL